MAGLYNVHQAVTEIAAGQFTQELHLSKASRAESPATRKRRPRTRVNPQAEVEMDFTGFDDAPDEVMQTMLTGVVDASGATVPAYIWTADGGKTGQTSLLTDEQFAVLTPAQQTAWQYGPVALPDQ
jgi:membrane peptidoglycan carboxypeptidase